MKKKTQARKGARSGRTSSAKSAIDEVRRVGGRVAHVLAETPEFVQVTRNDRALRSEMDEHYRAIGKRVLMLHKRARAESPFARYRLIMKELEALTRVEEEYRSNRARMNELRQDIRGSRKS